ncbi:nucleotidyltransferase domain-containing protein [Nitrolancea hollandica]|uniref:cGAS/DncV-like nucleotidyltransferase C-terminal helical domain-containing protein n=1 Tax=Nitrolancea hollandica Lb TaxID=1129897 RepID=I4EL16_9BACT|nr:nucleotidyltransferase [Nitrolancea hollandica]CCF85378.1 conserved hypothetical protein [Nitrolancea hollandica Lb]
MPIPEDKLKTWSHQGAVATAKSTRESIYNALRSCSALEDVNWDVYLQGSYGNDTNIYGETDVDIIVQLNSTFRRELGLLTAAEAASYKAAFSPATYHWDDFRTDVLATLREYYGALAITEGKHCINVAGKQGRLPADVVVALQYRSYRRFKSLADQDYVEGILFYTHPEEREVINYPKQHYDSGVNKMSKSRTNGWFKPTVRVFKNLRSFMVDQGAISDGLAPSYFLQGLIYNVPDNLFGASYQQTMVNILNFLRKATFNDFVCQNEQLPLFGASHEQWTTSDAKSFVGSAIAVWNDW